MADLTYKQLQAATSAIAKKIARASEAIRQEAKAVDEEAQDTARIADSIGSLKVDNATISETRELSKIMFGLSEAVIAYASSGDTTAKQAQAVYDQNRASHSGVNEAVNRSPVGRAIYDVNREWFRQE